MDKHIIKRITYCILPIVLCLLCSCSDFLDEKSSKKLIIPSKLEELQGLLDYYQRVNQVGIYAGEVGADNYYLHEADWATMAMHYRNMYIWQNDEMFPTTVNSWSLTYENIYRANTVLEYIRNIARTEDNRTEWDALKGHALFLRAKGFLEVAMIWSLAYDKETAATDLGIPLRLDPDFNTPSVRASTEETYQQIIRDFEGACYYLPENQMTEMRPSKFSAYGYLARTYLAMRDYEKVELYADSALAVPGYRLLDYNSIDSNENFPFERFNSEVLYEEQMQTPPPLNSSNCRINEDLWNSYNDSDLRKNLFFLTREDGTIGFRGSYEGTSILFSGFTLAEAFLMKSETSVRNGRVQEGLEFLNIFLVKRWKNGTYEPIKIQGNDEALTIVLEERRKELIMRGLRWMDIKRLNKEGRNITVERTLGDQHYMLQPNDPAYAMPIPLEIIMNSDMQQNSR